MQADESYCAALLANVKLRAAEKQYRDLFSTHHREVYLTSRSDVPQAIAESYASTEAMEGVQKGF